MVTTPNRLGMIQLRVNRGEYRVDCPGVAKAMLERFGAIARDAEIIDQDDRDRWASVGDLQPAAGSRRFQT